MACRNVGPEAMLTAPVWQRRNIDWGRILLCNDVCKRVSLKYIQTVVYGRYCTLPRKYPYNPPRCRSAGYQDIYSPKVQYLTLTN